jgi:hypothetical protein
MTIPPGPSYPEPCTDPPFLRRADNTVGDLTIDTTSNDDFAVVPAIITPSSPCEHERSNTNDVIDIPIVSNHQDMNEREENEEPVPASIRSNDDDPNTTESLTGTTSAVRPIRFNMVGQHTWNLPLPSFVCCGHTLVRVVPNYFVAESEIWNAQNIFGTVQEQLRNRHEAGVKVYCAHRKCDVWIPYCYEVEKIIAQNFYNE